MSLIKKDNLPSQIFDDQGVHLLEPDGKHFIQGIVYFAEKIYESSVVDLENELEKMDTDFVQEAQDRGKGCQGTNNPKAD